MRTRRSPRNQEILWRALGPPPEPKLAPVQHTAEEIAALPGLSKTSRSLMLRDLQRQKTRALKLYLKARRG